MEIVMFTHRDRGPADAAADLATIGFEIGEPVTVTRTVLDTFDGRLYEKDLRLEVRTVADQRELLLAADGSLPAALAIERIPRFAKELRRGPLRSRLESVIEMRALLPLFTFDDDSTEAIARDRRGRTVARATIHRGGTLPWTIEVASLTGHAHRAEAVCHALRAEGYEEVGSDFVALVLRNEGIDPAGVTSSPTVDLDPDKLAADGFRAVLTNLLRAIHANWQGTIDDIDTEFLHELRVAIRRSRSVLTQAKGVFPRDMLDEFGEELRWIAGLTGPTRDLDVYILGWSDYVAELSPENIGYLGPVLDHLREHREVSHDELVTAMRSPRTGTMLSAWQDALRTPTFDADEAPAADSPIATVVRKRLRRAHKEVIRNGRRINADSPAEDLHELRKDAKRVRYIVECFGSLLPGKERKAFVRQLKGLQDNLGEHQDAEVHAAELRRVAHELSTERADPPTLLALGQLTEQLELRKRRCREEFAERFATYDSHETRETFSALTKALDKALD